MNRRRKPPLPPIVTLIAYRPNGLELGRRPLAFATTATVQQHAREWRGEVRREAGWTPYFRAIVTHRDVTPFVDRDETATYLGSEADI